MNFLFESINPSWVEYWDVILNDWFFVGALIFLTLEFIRYRMKGRLGSDIVGDTITNYITLAMFIGINLLVLSGLYYLFVYGSQDFALFDIDTNLATIAICIIIADLLYYWEHRCMHRFNFAWATHSVHHSSPHFNISVAYRFGPMDGLWPIFGTVVMVLLGFHPIIVAFAEIVVQLYQTALHTEMVKKLPRPVELIFNTPSHHRVHHGSNPEYLDTNYGGIFILWDRLFGTFAEEKTPVVYGLVKPINSNNPLVAFFHGIYRVAKNVIMAKGWRNKAGYFFGPPEFEPVKTTNHQSSN
ncbi:sterol desaturase family protein [Sphingorhabdus sp. Alg239-R122]|uniref:sterol desaturase family protein n=1 Tax=Sphingorhabdus sp. Alg239-R122 TaxID=2305989 RepID=UPI0013D97BAA|nr:sterol desaturase family protein [Sphingorhabdus sp. Alg239-R122]